MNDPNTRDLVGVLVSKFEGLTQLENQFDTEVLVEANNLINILKFLKEDCGFNYLADMTALDHKTYFTVVYRVHSLPANRQLVVKVNIDRDNPCLTTASKIWGAADWQEREIYDLMGINFTGRSISRILLPEQFEGHPLRKDYQMGGQA